MASPTKTTKIGLRDLVNLISPPWLQAGTSPSPAGQPPGVGGRLMYDFGLLADGIMEKLDQGMKAHMPGYGTPTALPYLGADRQLVQAPAEPNASFILRLKQFLQTWQYAGSATSVLQQILCYFQPYLPRVTLVTNSGVWNYFDFGSSNYASTQPIHVQIVSWVWDAVTNPLNGGSAWWREWLLVATGLTVAGGTVTAATNASPIAITTASPHGLSTGAQVAITAVHGNLAANGYWTVTSTGANTFTLNGSTGSGAYTSGGYAYSIPSTTLQTPGGQVVGPAPFVWGQPGVTWGSQPSISWGVNAPPSFFQPMQQLDGTWKSAQTWVRWMVFSFDPTWGTPWTGVAQPSGGVGTGRWGSWGTNVNGVWVRSRNPHARYVDGV